VRAVHVDPPELGVHDGLAYARFAPPGDPRARLVVLHGAGSVKEGHYAWARACRARGLATVCFDLRGHGDSSGALDGGVLDDIAAMATVTGDADLPLVLRGSSLGGWLALAAGARLDAAAVVAICPAPGEGLARRLREGELPGFRADVPALVRLIASVSEQRAAATLGPRLLLQHAEGDETVAVEVSRALHAAAPGSRYVEVPGGHHRSVQHDGELQADALRWVDKRLAA
jgi:uncharacterized protein